MEKLVAIFSVLLIASLFSHPSQAEEREIKSTGGASLGKWKYKEIDPADALLEAMLDGRELVKVRAGYIGNSTYREVWNFKRQYFVEKKLSPGRITFVKQIEKSWIGYAKLPSGHHYNGGTFNEKDAPRMIFARTAIKNVDILKMENALETCLSSPIDFNAPKRSASVWFTSMRKSMAKAMVVRMVIIPRDRLPVCQREAITNKLWP